MESAQQLQMVVAEVQAARQQVAALNAQLRELEGTIAAVKEQPEDMALHRQMGTILVEVKDREQLLSDLEATLVQMKSAVETMAKREAELVSTYEKLKQSLEG
jgi:chaperonin cofactor prefoldin|tara:strand:+ start:408 stop:716 length:309 start_codon:yes stop_codon:yes gene_type:complete